MNNPVIRRLQFVGLVFLLLMLLGSGLRLGLLLYNSSLLRDIDTFAIFEAFVNGLRFDARFAVFVLIPYLLIAPFTSSIIFRQCYFVFLALMIFISNLLAIAEFEFYHEFQQRLNSTVFQYLQEDVTTVSSMIWYGFPVIRLLLLWLILSVVTVYVLHKIAQKTYLLDKPKWYASISMLLIFVVLGTLTVRGTLRQGSPLRWGDAYTTEYAFTNHLGLNSTLSLVDAARHYYGKHRQNIWTPTMDKDKALTIVRKRLLTEYDELIDADKAALRRVFNPPQANRLPVKNVVIILMESLGAHSVGALNGRPNITPYFDELAQNGLLFERFFSQGTHTHQGMFATMACFPNLPSFEYLMQTPEGAQQFSGLPQLLSKRGFDDVYVYNGNFQWDNQSGFFSNQGMRNFVGREDFVNPIFIDKTWGVSDQDMFDRSVIELDKLAQNSDKPFYALLQTLSNHTPYALPDPLPVEEVTAYGDMNEHLTAMRYADWALGQFFQQIKDKPWYKETLFVILGDHSFSSPVQVTDMNLLRFHVPLLLIAPNIQDKFGARKSVVGTQIDVVPTIMGRLGGKVTHQCFGRDLLNLPADDPGIGVIKASGGEQIVNVVSGDKVLLTTKGGKPKQFSFVLGKDARGVEDQQINEDLYQYLQAFLQVATESLLTNTAGSEDDD